jgi:hypothetical protein
LENELEHWQQLLENAKSEVERERIRKIIGTLYDKYNPLKNKELYNSSSFVSNVDENVNKPKVTQLDRIENKQNLLFLEIEEIAKNIPEGGIQFLKEQIDRSSDEKFIIYLETFRDVHLSKQITQAHWEIYYCRRKKLTWEEIEEKLSISRRTAKRRLEGLLYMFNKLKLPHGLEKRKKLPRDYIARSGISEGTEKMSSMFAPDSSKEKDEDSFYNEKP